MRKSVRRGSQRVNIALARVLGWELRPGQPGNVEHPTSNAEHRIKVSRPASSLSGLSSFTEPCLKILEIAFEGDLASAIGLA